MGALENALKKYEKEYFEHLEKFVGLNSFTYNPAGINALGQQYADLYETLGFKTNFIQADEENCGYHTVSIKKGKSPKNILLISHLDTVYSKEVESKENHYWKSKGELIYGPGTVDIKGGSVMIYLFLKALKIEQPELFEMFTWKILHNAGEEIGIKDFKDIAHKQVDENSLACLVYEGSCDREKGYHPILLRSRKASLTFKVEAFGRAAHSSNPQLGANAIRQISRIVDKIESLSDFDKGLTFSIGLIEGGTVANTVPDKCSCSVNVRAKSIADCEHAIKSLEKFAGDGDVLSRKDNWACQVSVKEVSGYPVWPNVKEHDWLVDIAKEACLEGGRTINVREIGAGASDANHMWKLIPVIDMMGPLGGNHHSPTDSPAEGKEPEFIVRDSILPQAAMNIRIIQKIAQRFKMGSTN